MKKLILFSLVAAFHISCAFGQETSSKSGEYYAVLIGINEYSDDKIQDLSEPAVNAAMLGNLLSAKYTFKPENVTLLLNATTKDIKRTFFELRDKLTEEDNLLIFFAGQSSFDQTSEYGYWMPADVQLEYEENILLNSEVCTYIRAMKAKHILLISDAVFAGNLLGSKRYSDSNETNESNYPSREAMTNGMISIAPDKSPFYEYLYKRLKENTKTQLSARSLFKSMFDAIVNNGKNIPQFATIQNTGDEGGTFIFIKKDN